MATRKAGNADRSKAIHTPKPALKATAVAITLPDTLNGKASAARAANGDQPVFSYIASLPQPQRGIAERIDQLAEGALPGLQRGVKWGMAYYGIGDGWCFSCGSFASHTKLMFINGISLDPMPPTTPVAMGKATRGVELVCLDDVDEGQIVAWMKQITSMPGVGKRPAKKG